MPFAFVAGATGYTGRETVRALVERGVTTYAHVRPNSSQLAEWRDRFTAIGATIDTTPWEMAALTERLATIAPTHVFALLGTTKARAKKAASGGQPSSDYEAVDFGLTNLLLEATLAAKLKPRFIYLSSAGVSASSSTPYLAVRWRMESILSRSGISYAIARPSFITGSDRPEDRPAERIAAKVSDGALAVAGLFGGRAIRDRYRSTDAKTLSRALVRLALDVSENGVFESESLRESNDRR